MYSEKLKKVSGSNFLKVFWTIGLFLGSFGLQVSAADLASTYICDSQNGVHPRLDVSKDDVYEYRANLLWPCSKSFEEEVCKRTSVFKGHDDDQPVYDLTLVDMDNPVVHLYLIGARENQSSVAENTSDHAKILIERIVGMSNGELGLVEVANFKNCMPSQCRIKANSTGGFSVVIGNDLYDTFNSVEEAENEISELIQEDMCRGNGNE